MNIRIPPLALICLLALAGVNAWLLNLGLAELQPAPTASPAPAEYTGSVSHPNPERLQQKPIASYGQTLAYPAFFKTRAPFVPPPPPPPPPVVAPPPPVLADPVLSVTGIIIDDKLRKAYLLKQNEPQGAWVTEGEVVQGWTVQSINPMGIALTQAGRTIQFALYPSK